MDASFARLSRETGGAIPVGLDPASGRLALIWVWVHVGGSRCGLGPTRALGLTVAMVSVGDGWLIDGAPGLLGLWAYGMPLHHNHPPTECSVLSHSWPL